MFVLSTASYTQQQTKREEQRKKGAAVVSEAKDKLSALKRDLDKATAKACAPGLTDAQARRPTCCARFSVLHSFVFSRSAAFSQTAQTKL